MNTLGYVTLLCAVHIQVYCRSEDESIILHSLKKRDTADQLGPIPYRQQEPQPITDASGGTGSHVYGHTAVLDPNLEDGTDHDPQSSIAGGAGSSYADRTPLYRQYSPTRTQGDERAPTYDYRQSSGSSRSQSSQSGSYGHTQVDGTPAYNSQTGYGSQSSSTHRQSSSRTRSSSVQDNTGDASQGSAGSSRTQGTQTDSRYTGYSSESGATARYSPSGTRRVSSGSSTRYQTGSTGPTGRRPSTAATYPLGPIISTGGQPLYTDRQTYTGRQVYRTPGSRTYSTGQGGYTSQPVYTAGGQPSYSGGQPTYSGGQPTYVAGRQPTYTSGGQRSYTVAGQPIYTSGGQPTYTVGGQPTYSGTNPYGQQPVYSIGGQGYVPYYNPQGGSGGRYPYYPNSGSCPETGIRMRINGMDCARAVEFYGPFLCYRHEATSRECCESCQPLKNPSRVGCEYGDHSYQCRQIQPHDCYDLRNRQSCCETCDRLRNTDTNEVGCEYGDMTPRCQRVGQNPSLCYIPENQRLCCSTCRRLRGEGSSQVCPWGDQNSNLCRPFDQYGGVRINCYAEPIRRLCCQTCERLRSRMPPNLVGCEYGDRPVIFNTGEYGSLNCTSFFRHFPVQQCQLNQAVSVNCCYTCHRYQTGRQRQPVRRQEDDDAGRG